MVINPLIYGEVAFAYEQIEVVDAVPPQLYIYWPPAPMPDFLIGVHAVITRCPLFTRDPRRYRQAFPGLRLITPESPPTAPPPPPR